MEGHTYLRTHDLQAEHMVLDLGEVVTVMHGESEKFSDRGSVTLVKQSGMNLVLTHLHAGATLQEHAAPGAATVQVLDGRIRVTIGSNVEEVRGGRLIAFDAGVRHSVQAIEDSALLITLTSSSSG